MLENKDVAYYFRVTKESCVVECSGIASIPEVRMDMY